MSSEAPPVAAPEPTPAPTPTPSPSPAPIASGTATTTTAAVEPYYKDWLQSDGKLNSKALDRLPDHLSHLKPTLERQGTLDDVLTIFANQQLLAGKKGLSPLPESAPPEVRAERKTLLDSINGVPKEAKDYGVVKPEGISDEQWNPKLADSFTQWAHKNSVSPAAVRELLATQMGAVKEQIQTRALYEKNFFDGQLATIQSQLKLENMPYDKAQALAERGAVNLGLDPTKPEVQTLLKNANAFRMAYKHAQSISEDKFVDGTASAPGGGDPNVLAKDIVSNKANPLNAAYWDSGHPQHKSAKAKVEGLYREGAVKKK